jgi:hypothetical protein
VSHPARGPPTQGPGPVSDSSFTSQQPQVAQPAPEAPIRSPTAEAAQAVLVINLKFIRSFLIS